MATVQIFLTSTAPKIAYLDDPAPYYFCLGLLTLVSVSLLSLEPPIPEATEDFLTMNNSSLQVTSFTRVGAVIGSSISKLLLSRTLKNNNKSVIDAKLQTLRDQWQ